MVPPVAAGFTIDGLLRFKADVDMVSTFRGILKGDQNVPEARPESPICCEPIALGVAIYANPVDEVPGMDIKGPVVRHPKGFACFGLGALLDRPFDLLNCPTQTCFQDRPSRLSSAERYWESSGGAKPESKC